jgi:hypothetical protein
MDGYWYEVTNLLTMLRRQVGNVQSTEAFLKKPGTLLLTSGNGEKQNQNCQTS